MKKRKLTVKQKKFADEYIKSGNATQAAIFAGYSEKSADTIAVENLGKPSIKTYIDARLEELSKATIAGADEVLQYLTSVMRGEETEPTLIGTGGGEQAAIDMDVGAKDRLKAAELLGKRYRLFTDKVDLNVESVTFVDDVPEDDGDD